MGVLLHAAAVTVLAATQAEFDKAVDILKCQAVRMSLDDSSKELSQRFESLNPCDGNFSGSGVNAFLQKDPETSRLKVTIALADEIDDLKNSYRVELTPDQIVNLLTNQVFSAESPFAQIRKFADNRRTDGRLSKLQENLKRALAQHFSQERGDSTSSNSQVGLQQPETPVEGAFGLLHIILILAIVGFLVLCISLWKNRSRNYPFFRRMASIGRSKSGQEVGQTFLNQLEIRVTKLENLKSTSSGVTQLRNQSNGLLEGRIRSLERQFEDMASRLDQVDDLRKKQLDIQTYSSGPSSSINDFLPNLPSKEELYFSTPSGDRTFDANFGLPHFKEGASIYKFTKTAHDRAQFQMVEHPATLRLALGYPDKNIDPVCDAGNEFIPDATRIVTRPGDEGKAELVGDKWKVTTKAKIYYEH
jgi:hypothetical protein